MEFPNFFYRDITGRVSPTTQEASLDWPLAMEVDVRFFAELRFSRPVSLRARDGFGHKVHLGAAIMLFLGSWLSGYFIISSTNAFMQHPVGHEISPNGSLQLVDAMAYLLNPWALVQYTHNMSAAVITGSFVVCAVGAFWTLQNRHLAHSQVFLKVGVTTGFLFSLLQLFPTGDMQGKLVAKHQPASLAAMEGRFESGSMAEIAIIGQPDVKNRKLENPIVLPGFLSFLAYGSFYADVKGLNDYPQDQWPDNIELLYYAYHIMVGLGTFFIAIMGVSAFLLWRGKLMTYKPILWVLMLAFPFPYIATSAGWMTAELGRQPWLIYGLLRTVHGTSPLVSGGNIAFSMLGFMGLYAVVGVLFLYLVGKEIGRGPDHDTHQTGSDETPATPHSPADSATSDNTTTGG
jgi:cytochrome d ubiquinol oxidase subunit I